MKRHFLIIEKDLSTEDPSAFLVDGVAYFDDDEYNFYVFTLNGYRVDNDLAGVWFGLTPGERKEDIDAETAESLGAAHQPPQKAGERKEDIDAETAEHYKQAFLNNGMRPRDYSQTLLNNRVRASGACLRFPLVGEPDWMETYGNGSF
jgi:hypothetical protein